MNPGIFTLRSQFRLIPDCPFDLGTESGPACLDLIEDLRFQGVRQVGFIDSLIVNECYFGGGKIGFRNGALEGRESNLRIDRQNKIAKNRDRGQGIRRNVWNLDFAHRWGIARRIRELRAGSNGIKYRRFLFGKAWDLGELGNVNVLDGNICGNLSLGKLQVVRPGRSGRVGPIQGWFGPIILDVIQQIERLQHRPGKGLQIFGSLLEGLLGIFLAGV